MVDAAQKRFPSIAFECRDLMEKPIVIDHGYDYVIASGIFYLRKSEPELYMESMVAEMFRICRKAVAFNSLSQWGSHVDNSEFLADPLRIMSYCHQLSPYLTFRHDYHPGDFTIFIYKGTP